MANLTSNRYTFRLKKFKAVCSNFFNRDAVDLIFSTMLLFAVTCLGSMLMICYFFELEKRLPPQSEKHQVSSFSTPRSATTIE